MSLSEICIRRPVLSIVMTLILVIVGCVSYTYLQLRQYPQVDRPVVSVTTTYEGASPNIIEARVTKILESVLAGIEGVDFLTSSSTAETSAINLNFQPGRDIDAATSDVRDRVNRVRMRLPEGARDSIIKKSEAEAASIIDLALYSTKDISTAELYDYAHHYLESELESIGGVAAVEILGSLGRVVHVWLDPVKMAAYRITTHDISSALKQQNVHIPAGRLVGNDREFAVATAANLKSIEAFENVIVGKEKEHLVKLKDVAKVEFSAAEEKSLVRFNGKPALALSLMKKSVSNPLAIAKELNALLPGIRHNLPEGMAIEIAYDKTVYIKQSLDEVYKTFFEATVCVFFVILLFLWSFRAAFIPLITIPVCIIATFTLLYIFGFSLNTLTLLAVVLAIGLVVDDAIVMMENIHRYIEQGLSPFKAALKGSSEISFAIIAMTLTLAAVYAPIALSQGTIGKLFTEFALTLAGSVLISGFVALTLSPMMCAYILKPKAKGPQKLLSKNLSFGQKISNSVHKFSEKFNFEVVYQKVEKKYGGLLKFSMKYRSMTLSFATVFSLVGILVGFKFLPSELAPQEDQGMITTMAQVPQGATINYISHYMRDMERIMAEVPEVTKQLTIISLPNYIMCRNLLTKWKDRKRSSVDIIKGVRPNLKEITGISAYASPGSTLISGGKSDDSVQFVLQTTKSQNELDVASELLEYALRKARIIPLLHTDKGEDTQEYVVQVDRDKAAMLGVEVATIGETFDTFISGRRVTDFKRDSEQFDVIASVLPSAKRSPDDLSQMFVRGRIRDKETMIPLMNIVKLKKEIIPLQINHYNQLRSVTLSGELSQGVSLGEAVERFETLSAEILPEGIRTEFAGETKQFLQARYTIYLIFGLALIFIFLVMAAQFESFTDPFIIMFTVPLSLSGAIITLKLVDGSINIYSQIGLITLIGLITKHGILIVEFANQIRRENPNVSKIDAVTKATLLRLRPILMTTAAMVLGAIPLVFASGAGAESRRQIGWVIFGGMIIGTLFTLFVIPAIYTYLVRPLRKELE